MHCCGPPPLLQDKAFGDELLSLVHAVRKAELRAGRSCGKIQVVDLGELQCAFRT